MAHPLAREGNGRLGQEVRQDQGTGQGSLRWFRVIAVLYRMIDFARYDFRALPMNAGYKSVCAELQSCLVSLFV